MQAEEPDFDRWVRRQRLTFVVGFLLGIALVAAAFSVGRWSAGAGRQDPASRARAAASPTRVQDGVPLGYAHTRDGAVAAATNFVTVVDGPVMPRPDQYDRALQALAVPGSKAAVESDAEKMMGGMEGADELMTFAGQGRAIVCRTVPLAYRLERYDGRRAEVSIWAESFVAAD